MTVLGMFTRKNLSNLAATPEVASIAFQIGWVDEEADCNRTQVWVASEHGEFAITGQGDNASSPVWRTDGTRIAYLQTHANLPQVFVRDGDGGNPAKLTDFPHGVVAVQQWCAKRKQLLVIAFSEKPDTSKAIVSDYLPYKMDGTGYVAGEEIALYVVNEDDGGAERVHLPGADVKEAAWAPAGEHLAVVVERCATQRHLTDLWVRFEGSKDFEQLTHDFPTISDVTWAPDGWSVAFAASSVEGDSRVRLKGLDLAGKASILFAEVELASPSSIHWSDDGKAIFALEAHRSTQRISTFDRNGGSRVVQDKPLEITGFVRTRHFMHWVGVDINEGPTLRRACLDGSAAKVIGDFNDQKASPRNAALRSFRVPDGNGGTEEIEGWLLQPDGEGPFPLLVEMHGGPHSYVMLDPNVHEHWDPMLAKGWAILALNTVGSSSYGEEFGSRLIGKWGELDLPQYLEAIRLLQEEGVANGEVVCFGHSYGGFLAAWALGEPGPWKAGIISAGVINQISHSGTSDTGYYVGPYALGRELAESFALHWKLSPLSRAASITAPTLILQGSDDHRCPVGQGEELHASLVRSGGARSRLVVYPGGTHHVSSTGTPSQRKDYYERLIEWATSLGCNP